MDNNRRKREIDEEEENQNEQDEGPVVVILVITEKPVRIDSSTGMEIQDQEESQEAQENQ